MLYRRSSVPFRPDDALLDATGASSRPSETRLLFFGPARSRTFDSDSMITFTSHQFASMRQPGSARGVAAWYAPYLDPQSDDRRGGPGVVHRDASGPTKTPAFCKKGSDHPLGEGCAARGLRASALDVRPEDAEVVADQHLLLHPAPQLRPRRQSHAVDERGRPGERRGRLAQHQGVSRDRRRQEVARLDADHRRHQRRRQTRAPMSRPTSRSIRPRTSA